MLSSLKAKFLIPIIMLIFLGFTVSGIMTYKKSKNALDQCIKEDLEHIASSTAISASDWIERNTTDIMLWSSEKIFSDFLSKDSAQNQISVKYVNKRLIEFKNARPFYENLSLINKTGLVVAATTESVAGKYNISDRKYFKKAITTGKTSVSRVVSSKTTGKPIFVIVHPIFTDNKITGLFGGSIDISSFSKKYIDPIKIAETGKALVFNKSGMAVTHPDKSMILKFNLNNYSWGKKILKKKSGIIRGRFYGGEKIIALSEEPSTGWIIAAYAPLDEIYVPAFKIRNFLILTGIILILTTGTFIWVIANFSFIKPLYNVTSKLRDIAEGEGDLRTRIKTDKKDEIGSLAKWFNTFTKKLHEIIIEISNNSEQVKIFSNGLARISKEMNDEAESSSEKAGHVTQSAEKMNAGIDSITISVENTSSQINMVAVAADQMSSTINEIANESGKAKKISEQAVLKAQNANSGLGVLGNSADEIGHVTETITEISEQINLLALNATIEAARAGDAGKGFAVVAEEIKNLAGQTSNATNEIKGRISGVQNAAQESIDEIQKVEQVIIEINEIVTEIASAVEEQSSASIEISSSVSNASSNIIGINESLISISKASEKISKDINDVDNSASQLSGLSSDVKNNIIDLNNMADKLNIIVGKFSI